MPNGKVARPADDRTSLHDGGSCHMGRAASFNDQMRQAAVVSRQTCRKIYTNYTHVVVRCKDAFENYQDIEMQKEKSTPPDWMVDAMRKVCCALVVVLMAMRPRFH